MSGETSKKRKPATLRKRAWNEERIDGLNSREYDIIAAAPDVTARIPRLSRSQPAIDIYAKLTDKWSGIVINTRYSSIVVVSAAEDYSGKTSRGVKIGSELIQVVAAYGRPTSTIAGRWGFYQVYRKARIIFQSGGAGRVQGWMIYEIEE